jgi:metal-responsive CopG/Arc/MetJ family transcriptional regulator
MKRRVTTKNTERKGMKSQKISLVRASISFPPDLYENLEGLAQRKKVSLAWVVRDAAERYVADETADGGKGQQAGTVAKLTRKAT